MLFFPLGLAEAMAVCVIALAAAMVQAVAGFGLALVAAPLLLLVYGPFVPGPMMAGGLILTVLILIRDHQHVDVSGLHKRIWKSFQQTAPTLEVVNRVILEDEEILRRRGAVNGGHGGDGGHGHVEGHGNAGVLGGITDFLRFHNATSRGQVRVHDGDGSPFEELGEPLFQVGVFPGADRRVNGSGKALPLVGVLPGDHIFVPGEGELVKGLA